MFISTKNILRLNLNKYNTSTHPVIIKVVAGLLYFLEYIIILPILIFFSLVVFIILLLVLIKGLEPEKIILIASVTIASIRVLCYLPKYGETISKDVAKIVPFTLLVFSLTDPLFFNLGEIQEGVNLIPTALGDIKFYIFFIVTLELILRLLTFGFSMFKRKGGTEIEEEETPEVKGTK